MPTVISIVTTSKIGIWNIPMRGQNFINNHYAAINNYEISHIAQQDFLFNNFNFLQSIVKKSDKKETIIIFCSTLQLLNLNRETRNFINFFKRYEINFSLELKKGKGERYLNNIFKELNQFNNKQNISCKNVNTYKDLFKKYKNKIV